MRDMVNFMLRCTGTDLEVDTPEVEDVDNAPTRIDDLQTQYHQLGFSEYPLISKAKKFKAFQPVLEQFFASLIQTLHHSSVLYNDENLFENIQIWISALSTSSCRPFRHTSAIISLSIMNTLCDIARAVMTSVSTSRKQVESEKKKKSVNKGRVDAIQSAIQDGEKKLEMIDEFIKDGVNIVFVHRYRDVDPRIRCECMTALGRWIRTYREYFFEGQFLRYFGWILSDPVAQTRAVVVDELRGLYENKDNIAGLRSFTERFRIRIVEMAAQDADVGVRASAVELLGLIREAGLIEPADIDTGVRLVFDLEPRVRKAAGGFFVASVEDIFESLTEELNDEVNETFGDEEEDDFASPKRSWIKFKCLVDILQTHNESEQNSKVERPVVATRDALSGSSIDSRFVLATEAIYPHFEELAQWQSLAGYLLYDHSQIALDSSEDDTAGKVKSLYKMEEGQEIVLLEVLYCAVKLRVLEVAKSDIDKRGRKIKALTEKIPELQEEIAHSLAQIIPQLLNKFGSVPEAASAVLRLEHFVDLDKIQDLQKDTTAYTTLLNDINKQFLTHSDQDVLAEASVVFLHAKNSDDMREALESKVQELWDDIVDALSTLSQSTEVKENDSLPSNTLTELLSTVTRVSNLASVTDCTQVLETVPSSRSKGKKQGTQEAPFNRLIHLVKRGVREQQQDDEDTATAEPELITNSIRTLLFFFMWKVQSLATALNTGKVSFTTAYFEALAKSREVFVATLVSIMQQRPGLDDVRFAATTTLLDLQTLFGTLRHAGQNAENDGDALLQTQGLVHEIDPDTLKLIGKIHSIAERTYAKKIRRPLEPAEDDAPTSESEVEKEPSDDDENESNPDEEQGDDFAANERLRSTILAEQRLCELTGKIVLAIIGRVLDASGQRQGQLQQKLAQHKSRLGPNYREVLSFLDERKPRGGGARKKKPAAQNKNEGGNESKSADEHISAERIEDDEDDENEGGERNGVEEDEEEDLRARELIEDDHIDQEGNNNEEDEKRSPAPDPDEDEVTGD